MLASSFGRKWLETILTPLCALRLLVAPHSWWLPLIDVGRQMALAVVVCLIDVCESISIARALAQKNKYRLQVGAPCLPPLLALVARG